MRASVCECLCEFVMNHFTIHTDSSARAVDLTQLSQISGAFVSACVCECHCVYHPYRIKH